MPEGETYPKCFGPYLRYAISTGFKNFEFFDETKNIRLFFLVEFWKAGQADQFANDMHAAGFPVELGPAEDSIRYATSRSGTEAVVKAVVDSIPFGLWERYVSRVELSLPVKPSSMPPFARKKFLEHRWEKGKDQPGSLLIGLLDDACPFAAAHFLKTLANGTVSTRVRGIWDQDQDKQPVTIDGRDFGVQLKDFDYGLEYRRDFALAPQQIGLDEWIGLHSTPTGSIDEDGCYADAKFTSLSSRQSHGAHVMDVFAGRIPTSSRVGPLRPGQDRRDPPNWKPGTDPAPSTDLVFVQFSQDCIRDAAGVWLKAYIIDGIRYILSFAHPDNTKNVVINISYGPTTGPHDGTAELEAAMTALVAEFDGTANKPKLEIVLAAGNSYLSEGHVFFVRENKQPDHVEWTWRLPPDNVVPCFAEVWMDYAHASGVSVTLRAPSGNIFTHTSRPGVASVASPLDWGTHRMWHLAVDPTITRPGGMAEHGDWTIKVANIGEGAKVYAYVARSDPNMGVRTSARSSYFVDPMWEQTRSAEANSTRTDGEFDNTGSLVCRYSTLNGIATAKDSSVHVAGGYVVADGRSSPYSSAGHELSRRPTLRLGPDLALPCDESYGLGGIRAGGNRSGSVFRLTGTSAAAPQLARHIANGCIPPAKDPPTSNKEKAKRGAGNIEPL